MSGFEELLSQLNAEATETENLAKSLQQESQDDENIQAAAGEGEGAGDGDGDADDGKGKGVSDGDGDNTMKKSLTLEDGEEVFDATDLIKSLQDTQLQHGEVLAKAMPQILELMQGQRALIQQQGEMLKSLQSQVQALGGQGRGRKAVVTIVDKPNPGEAPMNKSLASEQLSGPQILAKSLDLMREGKLTGLDVSRCENAIQSGFAVPSDILAKIK